MIDVLWQDFIWEWNHVQTFSNVAKEKLSSKDAIIANFINDGVQLADKLIIWHVKISFGFEHAIVGLECRECDYGKPAVMKVGLYPSLPRYCQYYHHGFDGQGECDLVTGNPYQLALEKRSSFNHSQAANTTFHLNAAQAVKALEYIKDVANYNLPGYHYNKISHNCVDFAREVFQASGLGESYQHHMYNTLSSQQWLMFNEEIRCWLSPLEPLIYSIEWIAEFLE